MIGAITPTPSSDERLTLLPGDLRLARFEPPGDGRWDQDHDPTTGMRQLQHVGPIHYGPQAIRPLGVTGIRGRRSAL